MLPKVASVVLYFFACLLFYKTEHVQGVRVEIMRPPYKPSAPEAVVIMIPGSEIAGEKYRGLGLALQANSSFRLWVALTEGYPSNFAMYPDVETAVDLALKSLRNKGAIMDRTFIAGHSLGGALAQDYASQNKETFRGVLLFGSYLPKWRQLKSYPLPILTISGDLDGMTRITRLLDTFEELANLDRRSRISKPVIIVSEMNHGHFVDPPLTSNLLESDIKSSAKRDVVLGSVSNYVDCFLTTTLGIPQTGINKARDKLYQAYDHSRYLFKPLQSIRALDQNTAGVSEWSIRAQELAAGLDETVSTNVKINNKVLFFETLLDVNANDEKADGDKVTVNTYTHLSVSVNTLDRSLDPVSPREMAVKMVSQDSIKEKLQTAQFSKPKSCKQINEAAFTVTLGNTSQTALKRWQTRSRQITWNEDIQVTFEDDWFNTPLNATDLRQNGGLIVTSVSWSTTTDSWPFPMSGVQYCKLIPPFRMLEWIYIDSLRNTDP